MRTIRTPQNETAFLDALAQTASVTAACEIAGIGRRSVYEWREEDKEFATRWEAALELGTDALEDEAVRRAREGVNKPVFHRGEVCGHVREYSDTLMIFMLKARRPEKFRDNAAVQVTGKDGAALIPDVPMIEVARRLAAILSGATAALSQES